MLWPTDGTRSVPATFKTQSCSWTGTKSPFPIPWKQIAADYGEQPVSHKIGSARLTSGGVQVSFSGGGRGFEMSMDVLRMSVAEFRLGFGEKCLGVFSF